MFLGKIAEGEEEIIVDLDGRELGKFVMEEGDSGDGGGADFDFVGGVFGEELFGVDEFCEYLVVGDEIEGAESLGDFIIGAAGEIRGVDWNVFEMMADEEEIGGEKLGEFVEVDGFYWVGGCGSF